MTDQAVTDTEATEAAPPAPAPPTGRRSLKRETKIRLLVIGVLALLAAAAFLTYYLIESRTYVTTDNAQIDGNQISITAPASGILTEWRGQQGTQLHQNAPVGRIEIQGGFMQPLMVIRAPADGVVAVNNGVEGSFVTAGTQLAIAYDGSGVFVTARVDETEIDAVHVGAPVQSPSTRSRTPTSPAGCRRSRLGLRASSRSFRSPTPRATSRRSPRSFL